MKLRATSLLISLLLAGLLAAQSRPKIGLALSGGGAMGFAHIGALKLLDSLQIPIDYIAGTSMGGILAGFYAIGYRAAEIEEIALQVDWAGLFNDTPPRSDLPYLQKKDLERFPLEIGFRDFRPLTKGGLISGQNISLLFARLTYPYEQITDFDQLPIPYRCIAVDLLSGREVVLSRGSLSQAMRATMSIPTVFSPVEWGDSLLIDGGLLNNLPVDVLRQMGAEIVIAVGVATSMKDKDDIRSSIDILSQSFNIFRAAQMERNIKLADIYIHCQLQRLGPADFDRQRLRQIIASGVTAARGYRTELQDLQQRYQLYRSTAQAYTTLFDTASYTVHGVSISGNTTLPFTTVYNMLGIHPNDHFSRDTLNQRLAAMRQSGRFESLNYTLAPAGDGFLQVALRVKESHPPQIFGVTINGNQILPFEFIYRLLGIKPGDFFDVATVEARIRHLYTMGYFETISYAIEPLSDTQIYLHINVKEHSLSRLRFGVQINSRYNLLAAFNFQSMNLLLPGLRFESQWQLLGYPFVCLKAYYPSRTLNFPVYPFIRFGSEDMPVYFYNYAGEKSAIYKRRLTHWAAGLGLLDEKDWNLEAAFQSEWIHARPSVGQVDSARLPVRREHLRQARLEFNLDRLDNRSAPRQGFALRCDWETAQPDWGSAIGYQRLLVTADYYQPLARQQTMHLHLDYGSSAQLPVYKLFFLGGPDNFVGVDYEQLAVDRIVLLRSDYIFEAVKNLYLKVIFNRAFNYRLPSTTAAQSGLPNGAAAAAVYAMNGYGLAIQYLTPLGPLEAVIGHGNTSIYRDRNPIGRIYISAGFRF